jgi:hypothetical protein
MDRISLPGEVQWHLMSLLGARLICSNNSTRDRT